MTGRRSGEAAQSARAMPANETLRAEQAGMGNTGGRQDEAQRPQDERQRPRGDKQGSREERLAAALRENLRRRKAQARARKGSAEPGKEAPVRSNPGRS